MVDPTGLATGGGVFLVGAAVFAASWHLARFDEQIDAIGSKRAALEVEPAGWKVGHVAGIGAAGMLVGVVIFLLALVS